MNTDVDTRIQRLETQAKWMRAWCCISVVLIGALWTGSMQSAAPKNLVAETVKAQHFDIVDASGQTLGYLGIEGDGSASRPDVALNPFGPNGKLLIRAGAGGHEIIMRDRRSQGMVWLVANEKSGSVSAASAPKGTTHLAVVTATMTSEAGSGKLVLKSTNIDPEESTSGHYALDDGPIVDVTPAAGLVRRDH